MHVACLKLQVIIAIIIISCRRDPIDQHMSARLITKNKKLKQSHCPTPKSGLQNGQSPNFIKTYGFREMGNHEYILSVILKLTSVFSTISVNSSKLIFPS